MLNVKRQNPPARYDPLIAYGDWRTACLAVSKAYREWADASKAEAARTHAAYDTALDREEAAAYAYHRAVEQAFESTGTRAAHDLGTVQHPEPW